MKINIYKINILLFCMITFLLQVRVHAASIPIAILDYTNANPAQMAWMNQQFVFKIDGANPNNPLVTWTYYRDLKGLATLGQYLDMKDFAAVNGYDYTKMVLHAKIDYTSKVWQPWAQMDKFDNFEGKNGVLLEPSVGTFVDRTDYAYGGYTTALNCNLYIGYEEPFDRATFAFSTISSGLLGSWQYWNGSTWTTLAIVDGTSNMTANGTIIFVPPSNWARKSVNGSRTKYFIRFVFTSAAINPVISTIKGDDWLKGNAYDCRGWSFTDSNRINIGTPLEYNPTPPVGSSARFPYQAQMTFWGNNHTSYNSAYKVNGKRATIDYLADVLIRSMSSGYTGAMLDQANALPTVNADGIDFLNTDFPDYSSNTMVQESQERLGELITRVHLNNPLYKIGVNGQEAPLIKNAAPSPDWNLAEYHTSAWQTGSSRGIVVGESSDGTYTTMSYDDYLPVNNPGGKIGVLIYRDDSDNGYVWSNKPGRPWDMANRGPIAALSKHLIAYNTNTVFSYHSNPSMAVYSETDQVVLTDNSVVHLSTEQVPILTNVKRWATYFPAMSVDFGTPTSTRDFLWKLGSNIGGGADVWRRDWSNAIILHRPGAWDTTDHLFNNYSSPIDLGGTFYPLFADGNTGAGITSISLRCNEGAILMKTPVTAPSFVPPSSTPVPPAATKNLKRVLP